eukprot:scaffold71641_cov36-Tisochrysis_lutea.AAC.2
MADDRKPAIGLNWHIVVYMYLAGFIVCLVLALVHYLDAVAPLRGAWLIFAPFGPSLLYALRREWLHKHARTAGVKPKDE